MQSIPLKLILVYIYIILFSASNALCSQLNNLRCPIEPTELATPKFNSEYNGDIIYFCCSECVSLFEESPEIYSKSIQEIKSNKNLETEKTFIQKTIDTTWNLFFQFPGSFSAILILFICLILKKFSFAKWVLKNSWKSILIIALMFDLFYTHLIHKESSKINSLVEELHSTTFLEYGEPLIPSISKLPASIKKTYYRGNDERNPGLYNGGNYRTAEFTIDLCNSSNDTIGYDSVVNYNNLFLRVTISKTPNTSHHFWSKKKMSNIYVTANSEKFHWSKNRLSDATNLYKIDSKNEWQFKYPLKSFSVGNENKLIKGIIYLCEKRYNQNNSLIGGRFHYAFQFDLKIISNEISNTSDLWMGPLYRKRSLRIWEIPESEWLSTDPIPINQMNDINKDPILIGIDEKD